MELRQKYGGRVKGTPNKITKEVKGKLQLLIDKTIDELSTANLSVSHKLKLLELALNYTLPKLAHTYKEVEQKVKSYTVEVLE
jgi:nicotinic acid mononucleotide adenylyltransferase